MELNQTFDVEQLPVGTNNYDLLVAGWYTAFVHSAEVKQTKNGTGEYIKIRFDITGNSGQGRVVFSNINIRNQNSQAEEIGRQNLGDIMRAIGLARVTNTDQLIGGTLSIKVTVKAAEGQYGASNEVKGYKAIEGSKPVASFAQPVAKTSETSKSAPPWQKAN